MANKTRWACGGVLWEEEGGGEFLPACKCVEVPSAQRFTRCWQPIDRHNNVSIDAAYDDQLPLICRSAYHI